MRKVLTAFLCTLCVVLVFGQEKGFRLEFATGIESIKWKKTNYESRQINHPRPNDTFYPQIQSVDPYSWKFSLPLKSSLVYETGKIHLGLKVKHSVIQLEKTTPLSLDLESNGYFITRNGTAALFSYFGLVGFDIVSSKSYTLHSSWSVGSFTDNLRRRHPDGSKLANEFEVSNRWNHGKYDFRMSLVYARYDYLGDPEVFNQFGVEFGLGFKLGQN